MTGEHLFRSFYMGGFECSCHHNMAGKRLDQIAATRHDIYAVEDYARLREQGILTARDGIRWHLIEKSPGTYDFSSVLPMLRASQQVGVQVIWDVMHYGWPDDLDIYSSEFIGRFARFARAFAAFLVNETAEVPFICPINEISYFSWAGGQIGFFNPHARGRGHELKKHLVRASIAGIEGIWDVAPQARIVHADPIINVIAHPARPWEREKAAAFTGYAYQAWDMLAGRMDPQLGGAEKYLDIIGINYYPQNQWFFSDSSTIPDVVSRLSPQYRPFRQILYDVYERYGRPMVITETGGADDERAGWLAYVAGEAYGALRVVVPLEGLCLYPIVDFPCWDDQELHLYNGLWGYADEEGNREIHKPLERELRAQRRRYERVWGSRKSDGHSAGNAASNEGPATYYGPNGNGASQEHDARREISVAVPSVPDIWPPDSRARLCLLTDSYEPSGLGEHMLTLASELRDRFRVSFVGVSSPSGKKLLDRAKALGLDTLALDAGSECQAAEALLAWLRQWRPDIVHSHAGIGWEGHEVIYTAREAGVPIVIRTEHLPYLITLPVQREEHRRLMQVIDRLILVSSEAASTFVEAGVPPEKIRVIRNGIIMHPVASDREGVRARLGLPRDACLVLTIGRMTEQKGHRYLIEAAAQVVAQNPNTYFGLVGAGPLEPQLRAKVGQLAIEERVLFLGRRDDVPELLAASDLFVLPSLFEGLPLSVLEAMALEVPVVGTRVCGINEAVVDGVTGRLVEPGNATALSTAILEVLRQPGLAARWAHTARMRFEREFPAARMIQETVALYQECGVRSDDERRTMGEWGYSVR